MPAEVVCGITCDVVVKLQLGRSGGEFAQFAEDEVLVSGDDVPQGDEFAVGGVACGPDDDSLVAGQAKECIHEVLPDDCAFPHSAAGWAAQCHVVADLVDESRLDLAGIALHVES